MNPRDFGPRDLGPRRPDPGQTGLGQAAPGVTGLGQEAPRVPSLYARNLSAGILYGVQAVLLAVVVAQKLPMLLPVSLAFPTGAPGAGEPSEVISVTTVNLGIGATIVLVIAAITQLLIVSPFVTARYSAAIERGRNPIRWIEYAASSAIMLFLLAQLNGIVNVATLVTIYTIQSAAVVLFWLQERIGTPARSLQPFIFGSAVGIVPWGILALHVLAPGGTSGYDQPLWIRVLTISMLVLFAAMAFTQWWGFRSSTPGRTYASEERAYILLSLLMKVAFAWQIAAAIIASATTTS